jgi:hypothetical protein
VDSVGVVPVVEPVVVPAVEPVLAVAGLVTDVAVGSTTFTVKQPKTSLRRGFSINSNCSGPVKKTRI